MPRSLADASSPTTRWPCSARTAAWRPFPPPRAAELPKSVLPDRVGARHVRGGPPAVEVLHEGGPHPPAARGAPPRADLERPALRAPLEVLSAAELPALPGGLPLPLHDVHREVHGGGVRQGRADAEPVRARGREGGDRCLVEPAAPADLRVLVAPHVELPPG